MSNSNIPPAFYHFLGCKKTEGEMEEKLVKPKKRARQSINKEQPSKKGKKEK